MKTTLSIFGDSHGYQNLLVENHQNGTSPNLLSLALDFSSRINHNNNGLQISDESTFCHIFGVWFSKSWDWKAHLKTEHSNWFSDIFRPVMTALDHLNTGLVGIISPLYSLRGAYYKIITFIHCVHLLQCILSFMLTLQSLKYQSNVFTDRIKHGSLFGVSLLYS